MSASNSPDSSSEATIDRGLSLLRDLLAVRSPSGQEMPAVRHLVGWLSRQGFAAHRDSAGNAIGVLDGSTAGAAPDRPVRELILLGHIDTVRGFPKVTERDGKLYGRGAVDAKGPLAAFATAAAIVGPRPGWRIVVAGAVEEESASSKGARHLAARRKPDLCIIGEPTGWQRMALGYKGRLLADVEFQRMMSHTAGPAAAAPELAFSYWRQVQTLIEELNTGRDRVWEQVQPSLRCFTSGDDGMLEVGRDADGLPPAVEHRAGSDEAAAGQCGWRRHVPVQRRGTRVPGREEHAARALVRRGRARARRRAHLP